VAQELDGDALFDDHRAGKIERLRAADGEIVDRAAHGKLADIAARKHQRIDHEGVGGEGEAVAMGGNLGEIESRLVLERGERGVVEGCDEHVVDQILHGLAAAAVRKRHRRHIDLAEGAGTDEGCDVHAALTVALRLPY
jgi:hypothetical protein